MNKLLVVSIISLIIGILGMPYGYYFLLRTLICLTAVKYLLMQYEKGENGDFLFFILGLAIIYNPIFPMPLGKTIWTIVNIITIATFVYLLNKGDLNEKH